MSAAPSGLLVVDKPGGLTSHDVVARVRRLAGTRKVGHAGTLDPMATGVLLVGVGRATRLLGHLALTEKAYDATIRLGEATSTDDAEGETLSTTDASGVPEQRVREAALRFVGELDQRPSSVSAVKVGGKRAYALVRAGETVELATRRIEVHELAVRSVRAVAGWLDVEVSVRCSSGTYVRALARDLGEELGVGGHLTALRRTAVGPFDLTAARTLEELTERFELVDLATVARACFDVQQLDEQQARDVGFGRRLPLALPVGRTVAVLGPDGAFLALYEDHDGVAVPVAVFV